MHMSVLDHPVGFGDEMPEDEERLSTLVATLTELADVQTIRACAGHRPRHVTCPSFKNSMASLQAQIAGR
jgi:hypothetical protein